MPDLVITYGVLAIFFAIVVFILQRTYVADRDFTDFAVAGRSFGGFYQAMAFLNTCLPGYVFLGAFGFVVRMGVVGMAMTVLLASIVMYLMADRVWTWGARHNLRTQPDLMALRYDSRAVRLVAAMLGILGLLPWMVLGMQSLGAVFHALSLGHISFATAVLIGVAVMSVRQFWTVRMGMRGIVISDLFQGIIAYFVGSALIIGLIVWLYDTGASLDQVRPELFTFPGPESEKPLLFFSLFLLPLLSMLCWPDLFVRLYTGSGIDSVKRSSAYMGPIAMVFMLSLFYLALLASTRPDVVAAPDKAWFLLAGTAGGPVVLALAGLVVFAASMGNIDATVQSIGAQAANDVMNALRGDRPPMSERALMITTQVMMTVTTIVSAIIAALPLPALFTIGLFAIQIMVQLAVPLYLGIFTRMGNWQGAVGGMIAGVVTVCALQVTWPVGVPWALGLTTGAVGLVINLAVFVVAAIAIPRSHKEQARIDALFEQEAPQSAGPNPVEQFAR